MFFKVKIHDPSSQRVQRGAGAVTCFRPLPLWFWPNWPEQQLLSGYPSAAAAAAAADDAEDDDDEDDALQLRMNPQPMARCWTAA